MLVRWITGHTFLGLQNQRVDLTVDGKCRGGGLVEERADHILLECPAFLQLRAESFRTYSVGRKEPAWEVPQLLALLESPQVALLEGSLQQDDYGD